MTARFTTLLSVAAIFCCTLTASAQNKNYKKALRAYERGSYPRAIAYLKKIESPDPSSRVLLAKALYQTSAFEPIESVLTGLTDLDDDARLAMATSLHTNEQYEKARALWKTFLDGEDRAIVYSNIGDTFYGLNEIDSAIVYTKKALDLDPLSDVFVFNLGMAYSEREESAKACALFFLSAQRSNHNAAKMYESENCLSWQQNWLHLVPGDPMALASNTTFPELHQSMISVNESFVLAEHGTESIVMLKEMTSTNVGIVFTFQDQHQSLLHRWAGFTEKPSFNLISKIEATATR